MRIAMVSAHASPLTAPGGGRSGGRNIHVAALAAALADRGHEVSVYTRRESPDVPDSVTVGDGYLVVHVPAGPFEPRVEEDLSSYLGDFTSFLTDRWTRERPDVIHAHSWHSGLAAQWAARPLAVPTVMTFHSLHVGEQRRAASGVSLDRNRISLERAIAGGADHVMATSSHEVVHLVRMGIPRRKVSVVPGGVDLRAFSPAPVGTFDTARRRRLVAVGGLRPEKGFDLAIAALASVPDTDLLIAGGERSDVSDDDEARRLKRLADRHGVADRVRLLGQVPHDTMPDLLRSADIVVCTPEREPFGMVALEAMACGVPVVATAVGGLVDTVIDGVTGVLVHRRTASEIAEAIRRLLTDEGRRTGYGMSAADRTRARYSWVLLAADTERIYLSTQPESTVADSSTRTVYDGELVDGI